MEFICYKNVLFFGISDNYAANYYKFRRLVVELVLSTDIASPERMQLTKSKFREVFFQNEIKKNLI